jgi:hypothetical protein
LAFLYQDRGRYGEAEPLYKRALAIYEKALGREHPGVALPLSNLAALSMEQGEWAHAAEFWRSSTSILTRRAT